MVLVKIRWSVSVLAYGFILIFLVATVVLFPRKPHRLLRLFLEGVLIGTVERISIGVRRE